MKKIITIGRQFGACGTTIGKRVARELNIEFYDKDIILGTAKASCNLSPEDVRKWDERVPKDFGFTQSLFDFYNRPLSDRLWEAQVSAIRQMADRESCVILGRNGNYILREFDHCLRVFLYADEVWRVEHMKTLMPEATEDEIISHIKSVDKSRQNYFYHYTKRSYSDATNFDLCLNVGKLGEDKCTEKIIELSALI